MYEVSTEASFSSSHHLLNYDGPCENVHGHNWLVQASVRCTQLDKAGIGIDFKVLKTTLKKILDELDHKDLNKVIDFNPSSENLAHYLFHRLSAVINNDACRIARVKVSETPGNSATYFADV